MRPQRPRRAILDKLIACMAAGALYAWSVTADANPLPTFELPSIYDANHIITSADFQEGVVYFDFWATWCAPCLMSMPLYTEMYKKYKDEGLRFVAINLDDPKIDALEFIEDFELDFIIPFDPAASTMESFGVIGMPTSYLVKDGEIIFTHVGFRSGDIDTITHEIEAALHPQGLSHLFENTPGL